MTTDDTQELNEITSYLWGKYGRPGTMDEFVPEAKQAITSLIKELVAEAKPGNYTLKGHQPDACLNHEKYTSACCGCQRKRARLEALDQFEQNLLKALEEK